MLINTTTLPKDTVIETDICIVGAGAAGITLARELINQPYHVCLLESGGLDYDEATQSLYSGDSKGHPYYPLKESAARYLGGSTNLWGGWSRPLDDIDFADRPWMPYSGWPITKAELVSYYERAQQICHLGPFEYDFAYWEDTLAQLQRQQLPMAGDEIMTCLWQIIPPDYVRFGKVYRAELEQAKNVDTYLHANVTQIETNDSAQSVTRLRVASLDGKQIWVSAKAFVLAVGGIENPRLLLASNQRQTAGIGNQHDLVGRFFMEHPYIISGNLQLANPAPLYTSRNFQVGEMFMGSALGLSEKVQEREEVLNFAARLLPIQEEWVAAFNRLLGRQKKGHKAFPSIHEGHKYKKSDVSVGEDLKIVAGNVDRIAAKVYAKLFDKQSLSPQRCQLCDTHLISEQAPNPDSRITLSRDRDRLGVNQVQLDWRLTALDRYTIKRSQQLLAEAFERSGLGELNTEFTDEEAWQGLTGSYHHMGTTRMSASPSQGVVNEDCRVHGISNLYIAGSSVFPTSGLSNPTLTIIALAIRLADHLKQASASRKLDFASAGQ